MLPCLTDTEEETLIEYPALTVTVQVASVVPTLAVIVAVPAFTAVTLPSLSTVATVGALLFQVIPERDAPSGFAVAVSLFELPTSNSRLVEDRVILFKASAGFTLPHLHLVRLSSV